MSDAGAFLVAGALSTPQFPVLLEDASQVAEARRQATRLMETLGFEAHIRANAALALTEAATNVLKHAGRGCILMRALERGNVAGLEILAVDQGPGIANVEATLDGGYSTAGSLGAGISSFKRIAAAWDIHSQLQKGTSLRLEFWSTGRIPATESLAWGAVCLPKPGETVCGDTWAIRREGEAALVLVVDGLGHGPDAAKAARMAVDVLEKARISAPGVLLDEIHRGISSTRGAAVGLALLEPTRGVATFAGVGNIAARIATREGANRHLVSRNGIVGHNLGAPREMTVAYGPGAMLIAHSDGLITQWDLASYPGLLRHHPAIVAGVLWRDGKRGRDDVTVLAVRNDSGPA
jgi:anti-sigma regulatory factor (Ser/Thr protein kinase)